MKPQSLSTIMRLKKALFEEFQDKEKKLVQIHDIKLQSRCFQMWAAICGQTLEHKILYMHIHSDNSDIYLPDLKGKNMHAVNVKTLLLF